MIDSLFMLYILWDVGFDGSGARTQSRAHTAQASCTHASLRSACAWSGFNPVLFQDLLLLLLIFIIIIIFWVKRFNL